MSAIKHGEKNIAKGDAPQEHPERAGHLGADWEKKNQGSAPKGPGPRDKAGPMDSRTLKTPEDKKRYLQRE
jgi:hypothetical protein